MPPPLKSKDVIAHLTSKGFKTRENDHTYYCFYYNGKKTEFQTKISHGGSHDIDQELQSRMAKQTGLSANNFHKLANCTMSQEQYIENLKLQKRLEE